MRRSMWLAGVGPLLLALSLNLGLGLLIKTQPTIEDGRISAPCAEGDWEDGKQFTRLCYSDIVLLHGTEHLEHGRRPYLDPCPVDRSRPSVEPVCDEYPVLTMYTMWLAARPFNDAAGFLLASCLLLSLAAGVVAVSLHVLCGKRALWFALAPTLLVYGFMNWDLLAVAFATAGTLAFFLARDRLSGTLLGLGTAAKLYPLLLALPFAAERIRQGDRRGVARLVLWIGGAWLAVNLPFALLASDGWSRFFRISADRPPDLDSLWFIGCRWAAGGFPCLRDPLEVISPIRLVNALSAGTFLMAAALVFWLRVRHQPDFPRWTYGLPLVILFLLTSKVYSPQFSLWLLPWFALALPGFGRIPALGLFAAFEAADVAVFVTRFTWFGIGGPDQWVFETAVVLRALVLVACLLAWVRGPSPGLERSVSYSTSGGLVPT
jgi:Glycosyltransferase family 87